MLHDVLEDCNVSYDELVCVIGKESADIVKELSFICKIKLSQKIISSMKEEYIKSFQNKSIHAIIIKIADRICNINDFKLADDKYAKIYFDKTRPIFDAYEERVDEIKNFYGEETVFKIDNSILNM